MKKKILMVLGNTGRGGTQAFIMNVLNKIDLNQFQIDFVVNTDPISGWGTKIRELGCEVYFMPKFKVYNIISYYFFWKKFLRNHKYNIVHGHTTNTAGIYLKVARSMGARTIAHVHSTGFRGNILERTTKRIFSKLAKKNADYWFACSNTAAKCIYGEEYINYENYYEIPNGIDVVKYRFNKDIRETCRNELGINTDTFLCGHVGTFSYPKNHSFVIDVFNEIYKSNSNSKLLLIGAGVLKDKVISKAKSLGVIDQILFLENIDDVYRYLMAMDLFLFPSLFEGFGIVSLEAQASGLPVLQSTSVPKETILSHLVTPLSLGLSATEWAQHAFVSNDIDRQSSNDLLLNSTYNLSNTIELLTKIYNNMSKN